MANLLVEAAQAMLTRTVKWSWLKAWGMKIARQRGMKREVIAVARRMAVVMHRMWVDGACGWTVRTSSGSGKKLPPRRNRAGKSNRRKLVFRRVME
jgi:hypothetical protein